MTPLDIDLLRSEFPDRRIDYYPSIDSTMVAAARSPLGTIVLADEQTAGQGRHGHSWHSEAGSGIYCSLVLEPRPVLTLALGLAAAEAIATATGAACDIRWPNDLMLGGKKVAGILVQLAEGKAIAGIGINVNQPDFPEDIESLATSLRIATGQVVKRTPIVSNLIRAVDSFIREDQETTLKLFTHASSYVTGRRVTVDLPDGVIEGVTAGLDAAGFLIVRKDDGTEALVMAGGVRAIGS